MSKSLYVGNLSWGVTEDKIRELFEQYGAVASIRWITDRDTGRFRGFCFIEMENEAADKAVSALNEFELDGRALRVNEAQEREDRRGGGFGGGGGAGGGGAGAGGGGRRRSSGGYRDRDERRSSW